MSIDIYSIMNSISHNQHYLKRYIKFIEGCKQKNIDIECYVERHHICPKSLFPEYKKLSEHSWNGIYLTARQHFIAHWILWKTFPSSKMSFAFWGMCNGWGKTQKITSKIYEKIKIEFSAQMAIKHSGENNPMYGKNHSTKTKLKISSKRLELIYIDGSYITKAKFYMSNKEYSKETWCKMSRRMSGENNIINLPGVLDKIRRTKSSTFIDGKNLDTIGAERAAITMKKEIINEVGESSTIYKENGKKISNTLLQIEENGKTKAQNRGEKVKKKLRQIGKWYKLKNVFDPSYEEKLPAVEIRNISPGLEKCTKEKYLGKSEFGKTIFKNKNKEHLIGLYVELI